MSRQVDSTDFLKIERKKLSSQRVRTKKSKIGPEEVRKLTILIEEISCKLDGPHVAQEDPLSHPEESLAKSIVTSASCSKKAKGERTVKTKPNTSPERKKLSNPCFRAMY